MNDQGQAMAEFAVAVAVLSIFLLGLPIIGRYHELQVATIEGARQLAFRESWRSASMPAPALESLRATLFPPPLGGDQPDVGDMSAHYAASPAPGSAGAAARVLLAPFRLVGTARFDLRDRALQRAELSAVVTNPAAIPEPFTGIPIALSSQYVLLGDGWESAGPAQVARRAGGLLLTQPLTALHPLLSFGRDLLSLVEPAMRDFCPGNVDPEQVPADRLGPTLAGRGQPSGGWQPTC